MMNCKSTFVRSLIMVLAILTLLMALPVLSISAEETNAETSTKENLVVTLDPGHCNKPSEDGSTGIGTAAAEKFGGVNEYFYTLTISLYCKERLEQYAGVEVHLTRETHDECPSLKERADIAMEHKSDALISIHNNSASNATAHGAEIIIPNKNYNAQIGADSEACANIMLDTYIR